MSNTETGSVDSQDREPALSPNGTGGQWSGKDNTPPEVTVAEETHGSFLYPPTNYGPDGVASYIDFWENVPISDRVISNLVTSYAARREEWIGDELDKWAVGRTQNADLVAWRKNPNTTEHDIRLDHETCRTAEYERLKKQRPREISPLIARTAARAAQMYRCSGVFDDEGSQAVDNYRLTWGDDTMTVAEAWAHFHFHEIADRALVDQDVSVQHELAELRRHMGAFTRI